MDDIKTNANQFDALTDEEKAELIELKKTRDLGSTSGFALFFNSNLLNFREFSDPDYALTKTEVIILSELLSKITPIMMWDIYNSNTITISKTRKEAICEKANCGTRTFERFIEKLTAGGILFAVPQAGRGVYQVNPWLVAIGTTKRVDWLKSKTSFPSSNRDKNFKVVNRYEFEHKNGIKIKMNSGERKEIERIYEKDREKQEERKYLSKINIEGVANNE